MLWLAWTTYLIFTRTLNYRYYNLRRENYDKERLSKLPNITQQKREGDRIWPPMIWLLLLQTLKHLFDKLWILWEINDNIKPSICYSTLHPTHQLSNNWNRFIIKLLLFESLNYHGPTFKISWCPSLRRPFKWLIFLVLRIKFHLNLKPCNICAHMHLCMLTHTQWNRSYISPRSKYHK